MSPIEAHISLIEKEIHALGFPARPNELYEPMRYILSLGGKRMRPVLLLLGHELFGGKASTVLHQAIAIELFHNFSLIHDDIMDKAPLRRGKDTVHKKWSESVGILSGDAMLVMAYQQLAKCDSGKLPAVLSLFSKTAIEVCEGQQFDMEFENRNDVSIDEYIQMIALKTSVLLGGALKIGALLADANEKDAEHLYQFGKNLGIAFQIHDDLLDAYGDPDKFGKKAGGDILAYKKTYLLLSALHGADDSLRKNLTDLLNDSVIDEQKKIDGVLSIYNQLGIPGKTRLAMDHYFQLAMQHLDFIEVADEKKLVLRSLSESLMVREH